jgi:hypothetical protein
MEKRGLSTIVATLIIILLTLVAVGIVWVVINNLLKSGAQQIELGQSNIDLQIKKVEVAGDNITVTIFVKRNAGQGNFTGINFIFSDGLNSEIVKKDTSLQQLEEKSFSFTLSNLNVSSLKTVSIAPILQSSGKETVGNIADSFDTSKIVKGVGIGAVIVPGNFEKLGYTGMGAATYTNSYGGAVTINFKSETVNPVDVHLGDNQTFTAIVYSPYNITNVTAFTQLDNGNLTLNLIKVSDDNLGTSTWSITWTAYDTHVTTYRTIITAIDSMGNSGNDTLTWTDACSGIIQGQSSTISADCTIGTNEVSGLDNGIVTIGIGIKLQIDSGSTFAYAPGYSIIKEGAGSIIKKNGGSIKKGYLFYTDTDGDNYSSSSTFTFDVTATKSGYVRAANALGTSECNDSNFTVHQGQTAYFTSPIAGTSSYDYNCDSVETIESHTDSYCDLRDETNCFGAGSQWYLGYYEAACGSSNYIDTYQCVSNCGGVPVASISTALGCH